MNEVTLVASLLSPPSPDGDELASLPDSIRWLEVRADLVGEIDPDWLRGHFKGRLIYALRGRAAGGHYDDSPGQRRERLLKAATQYDLIELDAESDLSAELLDAVTPGRRMISWHGAACGAAELVARFEQLAAHEARFYKLVTTARRSGDELAPLNLLKSLGRSDVVAYASGPVGFWSRVAAPYLGCAMISGAVAEAGVVAGEISIARLMDDYGFPALRPLKELYGIVGCPVSHSLSPRLHNAAYRVLNRPALFVPFHVESLSDFWSGVVESGKLEELGVSIKGLTVASPHKEAVLREAEVVSLMSRRAGAVNICVRNNGSWRADTTDPDGVVASLRERGIEIENKRAAVIGCGGAGRAVAAGLAEAGAEVMLVNRGLERGRRAVGLLNLPFTPLADFSARGFSIVVNATPVGRDDGGQPFSIDGLDDDAAVVDLVYGSTPTPLVAQARSSGMIVVDGRDVLLTQALRQFHRMIGSEMPDGVAQEKLGIHAPHADLVSVR
jgi:3-dehydroquinate dehydratase/shikimate dehydrogenase